MCTFTSSHITMSVQCTHAMFFCNYNLCLHLACSVQVPIAIHITSVDHRLAVLICTVACTTEEIYLSQVTVWPTSRAYTYYMLNMCINDIHKKRTI